MTQPQTGPAPLLDMQGVSKHFVLHLQNSTDLPVLHDFHLSLLPGECVRLSGPSGMGKSTVLKLAFGNYRASHGHIWVRDTDGTPIDITQASARTVLHLRSQTMGYVSQFLRVIPRVAAIDIVAEPLLEGGDASISPTQAREQAAHWLTRLRIPQSLWQLPPATFSGGEQQRINIARSFIKPRPLLLLDEPTRGVDVGARREIYSLLFTLARAGMAVLFVSSELEEVLGIADRVLVMSDGEIKGEISRESLSEHAIMSLASSHSQVAA